MAVSPTVVKVAALHPVNHRRKQRSINQGDNCCKPSVGEKCRLSRASWRLSPKDESLRRTSSSRGPSQCHMPGITTARSSIYYSSEIAPGSQLHLPDCISNSAQIVSDSEPMDLELKDL